MMLTCLTAEGYLVADTKCCDDVLQRVHDIGANLILLEPNLSEMKGLGICRALHSWSEAPIIVLSARNTERDKVMALDAGADDYLVKPFGVRELLARIRSLLRRSSSTTDIPKFECSELTIDFERRVVFVRGKRIRFTPKEFELLQLLVANQGKPLRHRRLLQAIWGPAYGEETEYLRVFIAQLRKKIEIDPSQPQLICTDPWLGYRFELPSVS
jgi:two-component system KDP operon response regulator KdpE